MSNDDLDRRLRDAGARLRAGAPDAVSTEAALDGLDGGTRDRRRHRRWVVPAIAVAVAATAAVTIAVVSARPDDVVRDIVPADTATPTPQPAGTATTQPDATIGSSTAASSAPPPPSRTAATITIPTTTLPASAPPYATDVPLDASAAIVGCPGTFGDLASLVVERTTTVVGVACAGDAAVVATSAPMTDGTVLEATWTGDSWTGVDSGTSHPCPSTLTPGCAAFGDPPDLFSVHRPVPPDWLIGDGNYLPATDATEQLAGLAIAASPDRFAAELGAALAAITPGDPTPTVEIDEVDGAPVVAVTLGGIPDDASSRVTYVVRYVDVDGRRSPTAGTRFWYCDRGVTPDDLCV